MMPLDKMTQIEGFRRGWLCGGGMPILDVTLILVGANNYLLVDLFYSA